MTIRERLEYLYWDVFKDIHGIRPRNQDLSNWSDAELKQEIEYLMDLLRLEISED